MSETLLDVRDLVCEYKLSRRRLLGPTPLLRAVDRVSFDVRRGQSFAVSHDEISDGEHHP